MRWYVFHIPGLGLLSLEAGSFRCFVGPGPNADSPVLVHGQAARAEVP